MGRTTLAAQDQPEIHPIFYEWFSLGGAERSVARMAMKLSPASVYSRGAEPHIRSQVGGAGLLGIHTPAFSHLTQQVLPLLALLLLLDFLSLRQAILKNIVVKSAPQSGGWGSAHGRKDHLLSRAGELVPLPP